MRDTVKLLILGILVAIALHYLAKQLGLRSGKQLYALIAIPFALYGFWRWTRD